MATDPKRMSPPVVAFSLTLGAPSTRRRGHRRPIDSQSAEAVAAAVKTLTGWGCTVTGRSPTSLSVRCTSEVFARRFGATVVAERRAGRSDKDEFVVFRPLVPEAVRVPRELAPVIGRVTLAPTIRYLADPVATPPNISGRHYLNVKDDVPAVLAVTPALRAELTGRKVRVSMFDSGFALPSHQYFVENDLACNVVAVLPGQSLATDEWGHGTAASANLFAVAPGIELTGFKIGGTFDDPWKEATLLEALQSARARVAKPQVYSLSVSCVYGDLVPMGTLSDIDNEIEEAILSGTVVVAAAGNQGDEAFPGSMTEVISVGGAYVDAQGNLLASDYASSYTSPIGRPVPDLCALCGPTSLNGEAPYLMLPVPQGSNLDTELVDGATGEPGWVLLSGTSSAAPQVAGVCALMLEKNPTLEHDEVKRIVCRKATKIIPSMGPPLPVGLRFVNAERACAAVVKLSPP